MPVCILDQKIQLTPLSLPSIAHFPFLSISLVNVLSSDFSLAKIPLYPRYLIGQRSSSDFSLANIFSALALSLVNVPLSTSAVIGQRSFVLLSHRSTILSVCWKLCIKEYINIASMYYSGSFFLFRKIIEVVNASFAPFTDLMVSFPD
jgi:hypothetical protein